MIFILLWIFSAVILFLSPFLFLLLYGLIASERDALGIAEFLNIFSPHKLVFRFFLILSFLYCLMLYIPKYKFMKKNRLTTPANISLICCFLILVVSLLKGYDIINSLSILVYTGFPGFFIWMLTYNKRKYRVLFLLFIFIQGGISFSVLLFPELSFINGFNYQNLNNLYTSESINFGLPGEGESKGNFARYGHFHNPNALGFYSCVLMMVAIFCFITYNSTFLRAILPFVFLVGLISWFNSLTRGPFIALVLYMFFVALSFMKREGSNYYTKNSIISIIVFGQLIILFLIFNFDLALYFFPDSDNSSVSYRLVGYINGIDAFLSNPLLGVGADWVWLPGYNPHFLPITWLADFGLFVAILGTILVYLLPLIKLVKVKTGNVLNSKLKHKYYFAIGLYIIVIMIGSTNNITATVLFWICLAECYIIMQNLKVIDSSERGLQSVN